MKTLFFFSLLLVADVGQAFTWKCSMGDGRCTGRFADFEDGDRCDYNGPKYCHVNEVTTAGVDCSCVKSRWADYEKEAQLSTEEEAQ